MKLLSRALLDVGADAVKGTGHMVTDLEEWEVESLGSDVGEGVAESVLLPQYGARVGVWLTGEEREGSERGGGEFSDEQ